MREALLAMLAFALAAIIIVIVEKYLVEHVPIASGHDGIVFLEFAVVLLVIGSFLLSEFLHAFEAIYKTMMGKRIKLEVPWKGIVALLMSVAISGGIFISYVQLLPKP